MKKPILITGVHRSGSTWLSEMLGLANNTELIREPFNLGQKYYQFNGLAKYWYMYAPGLPQNEAKHAFQKILDRKTGKIYPRRKLQRYIRFPSPAKLIIKDPIASLSSAWISDNFNIDIIVLVRHPAAFAASLKRINWSFDFTHFLLQEKLMNDLLEPFRPEMEKNSGSILEQAILLWKIIYYVLDLFIKNNKNWHVILHEEISSDPVSIFKNIYEKYDLEWTNDIEQKIFSYTNSKNSVDPKTNQVHLLHRDSKENIKRWSKVLTKNEIMEVYEKTKLVWINYYNEDSWKY